MLYIIIIIIIILLPFDALEKNQDTSLSEVLCKLILIIYQSIVSHEEKKPYFNVKLILGQKLTSSCVL